MLARPVECQLVVNPNRPPQVFHQSSLFGHSSGCIVDCADVTGFVKGGVVVRPGWGEVDIEFVGWVRAYRQQFAETARFRSQRLLSAGLVTFLGIGHGLIETEIDAFEILTEQIHRIEAVLSGFRDHGIENSHPRSTCPIAVAVASLEKEAMRFAGRRCYGLFQFVPNECGERMVF